MLPLEFPIKTCKKLSVPSYEKKKCQGHYHFSTFAKELLKAMYDTREKTKEVSDTEK